MALASGSNLDQAQTSGESAESRLVGLVVDGKEVGSLEAVFVGEQYYLPVTEIARQVGARVTPRDSGLLLDTPGGQAVIPGEELYVRDGEVFISGDCLRKRLATGNRFDASRYAVILQLPWWRESTEAPAHATGPTPDRSPPPASLSRLRLDYNYYGSDSYDRHALDYRLDGSLLDGGWRVDVVQDLDQDTYLDEYYWLQARDQSQVLLGRQDAYLHPLFPSAEFTGGQMLLSNRSLEPPHAQAITRSDFARSLARPQQDIRGQATAGAVAELRVEGRIVARQRVRLDGEFEFLDVAVPSRGYSQIEVFVRNAGSGALLEVQDFSRSASELLMDEGHQVALFGAGAAGNVMEPHEDEEGGVGIAQWRAGVSENLTLEASYQAYHGVNSAELGLVKGFGRRWVGSIGAVADNGGAGGMAELFGYGERWNLEYLGRELSSGYRDAPAASLHDLRYRYRQDRSLVWGGRARYSDGLDNGDSFVLPGFTWMPHPGVTLGAWPNIDGDYRIDAQYRPTPRDQVTYSYEHDEHRVYASHYAGPGMEYYFDARDRDGHGARFETGMRWFMPSDDRGRFDVAGISTDDGELGYYLRAEKTFLPGIYASLEIRDEPHREPDLNEIYIQGLTVQFRFTMDYSLANGSLVPATMAAGDAATGSIAGRLRVRGGLPVPADLDAVTLLIDGYPQTVPSRDGRFHLGRLDPGVYRVRLDAQSLPIELVPIEESFWVKVAHGAVTRVDFWVEARFGIAGRLTSSTGERLPDARIKILQADGALAAIVRTDRFGLYRVDGLSPGSYRAETLAEDTGGVVAAVDFEIEDDFMFGIDLTLPETDADRSDR